MSRTDHVYTVRGCRFYTFDTEVEGGWEGYSCLSEPPKRGETSRLVSLPRAIPYGLSRNGGLCQKGSLKVLSRLLTASLGISLIKTVKERVIPLRVLSPGLRRVSD